MNLDEYTVRERGERGADLIRSHDEEATVHSRGCGGRDFPQLLRYGTRTESEYPSTVQVGDGCATFALCVTAVGIGEGIHAHPHEPVRIRIRR